VYELWLEHVADAADPVAVVDRIAVTKSCADEESVGRDH
jgi:hypothetical protein